MTRNLDLPPKGETEDQDDIESTLPERLVQITIKRKDSKDPQVINGKYGKMCDMKRRHLMR
jgi:hypothetical protein